MFQQSCTASDEAFGIFTIERCWDAWLREESENVKSTPRSCDYTKKNSNKKYRGWTKQGMKRFNYIAHLVNVNRDNTERKNDEETYRMKHYELHLKTVSSIDANNYHMNNNNDQCDDNSDEELSFTPYNDLTVLKENATIAANELKEHDDHILDDDTKSQTTSYTSGKVVRELYSLSIQQIL